MILVIEDGTLILPENLYNADNSSMVQFHELQIELRNLDVYMGKLLLNEMRHNNMHKIIHYSLFLDMDVTVSPLTWTLSSDASTASTRKNTIKSKSSKDDNFNYLYIDGIHI
jgi:hypothetical protein